MERAPTARTVGWAARCPAALTRVPACVVPKRLRGAPSVRRGRRVRCDVSAPRRAAAALGSVGEGLEEATRLTYGTPEGGVVQVLAALVAGASDVITLLLLRELVRTDRLRPRLTISQGVVLDWRPNRAGEACVSPQDLLVQDTGDGRGRGAYAGRRLAAGEWVGDYEGERLSQKEFFWRYPDGMGDYCISDAEGFVWDGAVVARRKTFTCAHINHSRARWNVVAGGVGARVSFYTCREIMAGEELLLNYGRDYWRKRRDQEQA